MRIPSERIKHPGSFGYRHQKLKIDNHTVFDLVSAFPEPSHIKDAKTRRYIFSNENNLKSYYVNHIEDIIGLTANDMKIMNPYWRFFSGQIECFDNAVLKQRSVMTKKNQCFLDPKGIIHIQHINKAPVLNYRNRVSAILTTSFNVTHQINDFVIFDKYMEIYKKKEACFYFMRHLGIDIFFNDVLSVKQMLCLLNMKINNKHKYIKNKMHIENKTIESHINSIANKLKSHQVSDILDFLRSPNQDVI